MMKVFVQKNLEDKKPHIKAIKVSERKSTLQYYRKEKV